MEKVYLIYKHTNKINGKIYIGQTYQDPERRQQNGISAYSHNKHFLNAINKYGQENFEHEVLLENLSEEEMKFQEDYYIEFYDARNPEKGYNILKGGQKSPFQSLQEDPQFREKISKQQSILMKERIKDPKVREEMRQRIIKSQEEHPERRVEYAERMKKISKELQQNEEYRKEQSDRMKKLQQNEECRKKFIAQTKINAKNNQNNPDYRKKICKSVINVETNQHFESGAAAARQCGVDRSTITKALKNGRSAGKHPVTKEPLHWRYATEGSDDLS